MRVFFVVLAVTGGGSLARPVCSKHIPNEMTLEFSLKQTKLTHSDDVYINVYIDRGGGNDRRQGWVFQLLHYTHRISTSPERERVSGKREVEILTSFRKSII